MIQRHLRNVAPTTLLVVLMVAMAALIGCGGDDDSGADGEVDLDQQLAELMVAPESTSLVEVETDFSSLFGGINEGEDSRFDARQIVDSDANVLGVLMVWLSAEDSSDGAKEFVEGLSSQAESEPEEIEIGGQQTQLISAPPLSMVPLLGSNYAVVISAFSDTDAIDLAESYIAVSGVLEE